ncbi:chemotaxis protein CheB [Actinomycetospora straminea]|uniref:protein-glutamate methylesterase n=1 Tax=Actinomycetospora straminea TaxID=663607 RepID=A0ABP9EP65_9PSEU|nr:chemotaxis protein CheB [Actinomycetospora straminea]MDD7933145.1 chemotaxis protein CheB [Actinomycetospora straminea]
MTTGGPPVVVLACSAGGLDALHRVLGPLPADFGAAVVVLQHQRPIRHSRLAPVLARWTRLPVRDAVSGDALKPGVVLVVPPGQHALATPEGTLALVTTDATPPYRPSADLLLATLAITAGPRVVAVILSGLGHDGATGANVVHDFGGTVLASDRATSAHFAMPEAAISRDDAVNRVLPVDDIPAALVEIVDDRPDPVTDAPPEAVPEAP